MPGDIMIVGLNGALQRTITLNSLAQGAVNRGQSVKQGIGGKGQNVYVAAKKCQETSLPVKLVQFVGSSFEGEYLTQLLSSLARENTRRTSMSESDLLTVRTPGRQRTAITLVDNGKGGEATEIVEPGEIVPTDCVDSLLLTLNERYKFTKVSAIAFMGSMPPGCPKNTYCGILRLVADENTKVLLDTVVLDDVFQTCVEMQCEVVLKVNGRELCSLADIKIQTTCESVFATPKQALEDAANNIFVKYAVVHTIAVTDGAFAAHVFRRKTSDDCRYIGFGRTELALPKLPSADVNPIGAGDAVASGTLIAWATSRNERISVRDTINEAFKWGLCCGAASCLSSKCSTFERSLAEELYEQIK
ncbi:hypothetical protein SARC_10687 [Sphaeroforma arctica JP610]|uniref:Carbohydrate kinase PfkB domain-containing protein n=1 Tax=Sphaeroforma arctica JP610 TaxID=667725 RepID=A0A0L0FLD3_9EUKA|nr:hypothetical protein SARC_10687 [Sphaeroforma arctica JP610]KNC76838.1 hypothetical protein SARC_10687 [Sphaeroforma arctica JP610]|eukprot:XP_014150740.1 hypothetical protein SARC_10687 [Sphaeroforma arctica JP610]